MKKYETGTVSEGETADQLEREVLPAWREVGKQIADHQLSPAPQSRLGQLLVDYVSAYEAWWTELAHALREGDSAAAKAATRHRDRAEALGKRISAWKP